MSNRNHVVSHAQPLSRPAGNNANTPLVRNKTRFNLSHPLKMQQNTMKGNLYPNRIEGGYMVNQPIRLPVVRIGDPFVASSHHIQEKPIKQQFPITHPHPHAHPNLSYATPVHPHLQPIPNPNPKLTIQQTQTLETLQTLYNISSPPALIHQIYSMFDELALQYNPSDREDFFQLATLLCLYVKYPSTYIGELHRDANRLGAFDVKEERLVEEEERAIMGRGRENGGFQQEELFRIRKKFYETTYKEAEKCTCCLLPLQQQQLSFSTNLNKVNNLGISTHLYFQSILNTLILLSIMLALFALFAIATNIVAALRYKQNYNGLEIEDKVNTFSGLLAASIGSKFYVGDGDGAMGGQVLMHCWLGLVAVLVWAVAFLWLKMRDRRKQAEIACSDISPAKYTLKFEQLPQDISPQQLQTKLQQYLTQIPIPSSPQTPSPPIQIRQLNKIATINFDQTRKQYMEDLKQKLKQNKTQLIEWVQYRRDNGCFGSEQERGIGEFLGAYCREKQGLQRKFLEYKSGVQFQEFRRIGEKPCIDYFVTFQYIENKELIEKLHQGQSSILFNLPCFRKKKYFQIEQGQPIKIKPAPEPQDVRWRNLNISFEERMKIKATTFFITVVLLCLSFLITLFLNYYQNYFTLSSKKENGKGLSSYVISSAISITLVGFNFIIAAILSYLTQKQANVRESLEQSSIGQKTVFATLINIILVPIVIDFVTKANLFGVDGLADEVTSIAISNALLGAFLTWLNAGYWFKVLYLKWKSRPSSKLRLNQKQFNILSEGTEFEIGLSYANIITMFLFACFFAPLQPLVIPITMLGLVLAYLGEKYNLFKKCKKPVPGTNEINNNMFYLFCLGPLFYSLGSFLFTDVVGKTYNDSIANILAIIVSLLILLVPYNLIASKLQTRRDDRPRRRSNYDQDQKYFINSYDYSNYNPLQNIVAMARGQENNRGGEDRGEKQEVAPSTMLTATNNEDRLLMAQIFGDDLDEGQKYWKDTQTNNLNKYTSTLQEDAKMKRNMRMMAMQNKNKKYDKKLEITKKLIEPRSSRNSGTQAKNWYDDLEV